MATQQNTRAANSKAPPQPQPQQQQQQLPPPPPGYYYYNPPQSGYYKQAPPQQMIFVEEEPSFTFNSKEIRLAFIRKVYLILTVQLVFTTAVVAWFLFEPHTKKFVQRSPAFLLLAFAIFIVVYISIICCRDLRRSYPGNVILLCILTGALAYLAAVSSSFYSEETVLISIAISAGICFAVSLFAMQTKFDFTTCGMFLLIASLILLVFGLLTIFFHDRLTMLIYSCLAALLFTLYLAFDTQLIMGGRTIEISPEEYVLAALMLYVDVVMIFLNVQRIVGST